MANGMARGFTEKIHPGCQPFRQTDGRSGLQQPYVCEKREGRWQIVMKAFFDHANA